MIAISTKLFGVQEMEYSNKTFSEISMKSFPKEAAVKAGRLLVLAMKTVSFRPLSRLKTSGIDRN